MYMMEMFNLNGKKAIVTGGSGGLGCGAVEALCEAGAEVLILDLSPKTEEIAASIAAKGYRCHGVVANLGNRQSIEEAFARCMEALGGRVDILVNAAGICRREKCELFSMEDWDSVINVNLTTLFSISQLAARVMLANGAGKIINFASMLSFFGGHSVPSYAASKGGVMQLTRSFANDWASRGIQVNAIAPGYMNTSLNTGLMNDKARYDAITARIPAGRWGTKDDLKGVIVFLSSAASDYINGAIIPVDGGYMGG